MVLGAVCARGGSKGVPRKNLRVIAGKSLVARAVESAKGAKTIDRVVVSTEDQEIADLALQAGAEVPFMRPAHLAQDKSSKWDVFRHLVETLEKKDGKRIDFLADLDAGVPVRTPEDIDGCVRQLQTSGADVVVTAYEAERNPYFNMVEPQPDGFVRLCKPSPNPVTGRQGAPPVYSLTGSIFAIRRDALWSFDHWSQSRMQIYVIPRERAIDIDTEIDFRFAEFLLQAGRKNVS